MKFFGINLIFFLHIISASSQTVSFSEPKKLSTKTPEFRILGKNNEGVIVYKYGRTNYTIEAYNNRMTVRWTKNLSFKHADAYVRRLVVYPEKTLAFYLSGEKNFTNLYGERWNTKFSGDGNAVRIDSINIEANDVSSLVRIAPSQNQSKIAAYYPVYQKDEIEKVRVILLDNNLQTLSRKEIYVHRPEQKMLLRKVFPDNNGKVFILLEEDVKSKKKGVQGQAFIVKMFDPLTKEIFDIDFEFQRPVYSKLYLEADNVNNNLVAAGFYTDDIGEEAQGFFYTVYDIDSQKVVANTYSKFSPELIFEITGKDTSKNVRGFYSFEIYNLTLRFDGGAVVTAESRFDTQESMQVPSFTPSIGPSFRTINISYFNDIMLLSVMPDGSLDWSTVLKKKQISEDDDGFFSSFALTTTSEELHFVYNEEIYHKASVAQYSVNKNGEFTREQLFNSADKNVLLVPSLAKQISASEILIPSYKRNYLSFVKITY